MTKRSLLVCLGILFSSLFIVSGCQRPETQAVARWQHAVEGSYAAALSRDAKLSVVSSIHHGIALWDIDANALKYTWYQRQETADNLVLAVAIADNNSHVISANREEFALWNADTGVPQGYWKVRESNIRDVAVSNDGRHMLVGKSNGVVVHITRRTGRRLEFIGHQEKINSVDMLPNGRVAISGSSDFVAYVWDTETGQVIYRFNHPSRVTKVALDPQGRYAFTADSMKKAHIWDLKTGELISSLQYTNRQEVFSSVRFSPDGQTLATGAPSRLANIWDIKTGQRLQSFKVSTREDIRPASAVVYSVAFGDNNTLITESSSGFAEQWQIKQK